MGLALHLSPKHRISFKGHLRVKTALSLVTASFLLISLVSCVPYRYHTRDFVACQEECEPTCHQCREQAREHWLYDIIPRHRSQIYWYDVPHWITWALFGNDDDGIFGEEPTSHFHCNETPSLWKGRDLGLSQFAA